MTIHNFLDLATGTIVVCSVLHTFLPPWDMLHEFPTAQKYYKVIVYTVGYVAINGRSTVYQQLSMNKQIVAAEDAASDMASRTTSVTVTSTEPK